jgi:hypothetical protein
MLKIILGHIKSWFVPTPDIDTLTLLYKRCLYVTGRAKTLSELIDAKKLIKSHGQLTNKYNLSILQDQQKELVGLWNHRYKLWKYKGY